MTEYNEFDLKYWKKNVQYTETVKLPAAWNALNKRQLLYIAEYWEAWTMLMQANETLIKAKALLLIELISGKMFPDRQKKIFYINQLDNESQYALCELTNFVFEKNTLTKNLFPVIRIGRQEFFGPPDYLGGMTAHEFSFVDGMYMVYSKTKAIEDLEIMIAVLYRPGGKQNGDDRRNPFDRNFIGDNIKYIQRLSYAEKQAILLFYIGCRNYFISTNPNIWSQGEAQTTNKSWIDVIIAMSGGRFGNFRETCDTDITLVFKELDALQQKKSK